MSPFLSDKGLTSQDLYSIFSIPTTYREKRVTIQIYNTFSRKKETFETIKKGRVQMYVCGPTVYDSCHIGHARSVVVFDVIARYLRSQGYEVTYVRNFTDVDDKIINKAKELGIDSKKVAEKYIN